MVLLLGGQEVIYSSKLLLRILYRNLNSQAYFLIYSLLTRISSCLHSTLTLSGENLNWVSRQTKQEREEEEEKRLLTFNSQLREKCPQSILKKSVTSNINGGRLMFAQRREPSPQLRQCKCHTTASSH